MKVYKYNLIPDHPVQVYCTIADKLIHVGTQDGFLPTIWIAHLDPDQTHRPPLTSDTREYSFWGTGHEIPENYGPNDFVGSVICGPLVWHVTERKVI